MTGSRELLERRLHCGGQASQRLEFLFVARELRTIGQLAVNQQVRDFFELAMLSDIENVIAAVMKIVAGPPDCRKRGIARFDT